jgi:NDP-sugar pyrophosphorylase family protein
MKEIDAQCLLRNKEHEPNFGVNYAIILAGGQGKRLGLVDRPKPMAEVNGKPIIDYQLSVMQNFGIKNVVFAVGFKHEVLSTHIGKGERYGISARMSIEDVPLGRGGAIKKAMKELPDSCKHFLVTNGDNIWRFDLELLLRKHIERNAIATIVVVQPRNPFGVVEFDDTGRVRGFDEKPKMKEWINAGIYVLSKEIGYFLPDVGDIETETFPNIVDTQSVYVHKMSENDYWRPIDTRKDLQEANEYGS